MVEYHICTFITDLHIMVSVYTTYTASHIIARAILMEQHHVCIIFQLKVMMQILFVCHMLIIMLYIMSFYYQHSPLYTRFGLETHQEIVVLFHRKLQLPVSYYTHILKLIMIFSQTITPQIPHSVPQVSVHVKA